MKEHHWSGWPGAFCLDCGTEDPWELAIANSWYDPYTEMWRTEEEIREYYIRMSKKHPDIKVDVEKQIADARYIEELCKIELPCSAGFNKNCGQCLEKKRQMEKNKDA